MVILACVPVPEPDEQSEVSGKLTDIIFRSVEPVGKCFFQYSGQRNRLNSSFTHSESSEAEEDNENELEIKVDVEYLRGLDPKEWKKQDHYAVLGLQELRFKGTDEQIKQAYRKMVLAHHPDKRKSGGEQVDADNDYFTCITKAYEILGNSTKRRSYDSVDPEVDDSIPPVNNFSKENFFEVFGEVFARNARWSNKRPVRRLGNEASTIEDVDSFYSFWYDFDSWREFSYMDEEEKEKGENREERRWIEKQNKAVRIKRKKEEMTRIRQLVDNAYGCDPRIQRFKDEEKQKKLLQKQARQQAAKAKAEEEEKLKRETLEAQQRAKEKEEEETKQKNEALRKAKEATKKALKKERKTLRTLCKNNNYYAQSDDDVIKHMAEADKLCELLNLESLEKFNKVLNSSDSNAARAAFLKQVKDLNDKLDLEKRELFANAQKMSNSNSTSKNSKEWSHEDLQLLTKAVNLFPAGTNQRWEVVATYINQHSNTNIKRQAKEVLAKANDLKKLDPTLKEEVNKQAFNKFEKAQKVAEVKDEPAISERFDTPAEQQGLNPDPWTAEEQRLLEQALKTYPASTQDRWDRIAENIPNRNKKDCMKRYKELVEMVRAKKALQEQAGSREKK